jgi:hypothetical protein
MNAFVRDILQFIQRQELEVERGREQDYDFFKFVFWDFVRDVLLLFSARSLSWRGRDY